MSVFDIGLTHENLKKLCDAIDEQADEIERLREALNEISFRIDNLPKGMTFKPQDPLFDLIRTRIRMALQQKESE